MKNTTNNNATANTTNNTTRKTISPLSNETMQSMTVKDLVSYINDTFTDKMLARFEFTRPSARAKKADLILFVNDMYDALRKNQQSNAKTAPVAADKKPVPPKKTTTPAPAKKAPTKTADKPAPADNTKVQTKERTSRKERELASKFPDVIERQVGDELIKYTKCDDLYHTMKDLKKASEDNYSILFACFWSPRLLKQFDYAAQFDVDNVPKAFADDLDVAELLICCDTMNKVYAMSLDTEAMYAFREEDLEPIDNIRVANGLEFEIYQHKNESEDQ